MKTQEKPHCLIAGLAGDEIEWGLLLLPNIVAIVVVVIVVAIAIVALPLAYAFWGSLVKRATHANIL